MMTSTWHQQNILMHSHSWSLVVTRGHSWSTRGHSWSTRGYSWSLVCTFRHDRANTWALVIAREFSKTFSLFCLSNGQKHTTSRLSFHSGIIEQREHASNHEYRLLSGQVTRTWLVDSVVSQLTTHLHNFSMRQAVFVIARVFSLFDSDFCRLKEKLLIV